jgi:hypothetical protein
VQLCWDLVARGQRDIGIPGHAARRYRGTRPRPAENQKNRKTRNKGKACVQKEQISSGQMENETKGNRSRSGRPWENQDLEQNDFRSWKNKSDNGEIISTHKLQRRFFHCKSHKLREVVMSRIPLGSYL